MITLKKLTIFIWLPSLLGLILILITKWDLYQFYHQDIDVKTMLSREVPVFILGLVNSTAILFSSVYWLLKKRWKLAIQAIVSMLIFFLCFMIAGYLGGAFLNAT